MKKKSKRAQGQGRLKDLAARKGTGAAVKGGLIRITNVRVNANGIGF